MGNNASLEQQRDDLFNELTTVRSRMIEYELHIQKLEARNFELQSELKKYEKSDLLSSKPRREKDEDIL